jgi:hypothetical protein
MKLKQSKFEKELEEAHRKFAEDRKKKKCEIMKNIHKYHDKKCDEAEISKQ